MASQVKEPLIGDLTGSDWRLNLARAEDGEKLSGSRHESHVKLAVAKMCNTEPDDLAQQSARVRFRQGFPGVDLLLQQGQ